MTIADGLILGGTIAVLVGAAFRFTDTGLWWPLDLLDAVVDKADSVLIGVGLVALAIGLVARVIT